MDLDKTIKKRHSVRKFKSKKPDWRMIIEAIDLAKNSPYAGNIPTIKFLLIDDKDKIDKISKACQQSFIKQVKYIVVICNDKENLIKSYEDRGEKYGKQQAGAVIQNLLLKITDLGLATCWVGAFSDNQIKKILDIPKNIDVEALLPIGYEMGKSEPKSKPDLDNILFFNTWGEKHLNPVKKPRD
jgi:nitroreductase